MDPRGAGRQGPRSRQQIGQDAEQEAARFLQQLGYRVLCRNYRLRQGEIDVVALEGETLCFVEVRSRLSARHGDPLETVTPRKQRRIRSAARHYLAFQADREREVRFDVVGILDGRPRRITLIRGAFE